MKTVHALRLVSFIEGLSYLLLVLVAMPLKYVWEQPIYVRWAGSAHGLLFVAFVAALIIAAVSRKWSITRPIVLFVASMVPFGFIYIEHTLREEVGDEEESLAAAE